MKSISQGASTYVTNSFNISDSELVLVANLHSVVNPYCAVGKEQQKGIVSRALVDIRAFAVDETDVWVLMRHSD